MIKIVLLLLLFLIYVSAQREGLRNYNPITRKGKIYGVNIIKNHPNHIYNRLTTPNDPLYQERFTKLLKSDIILDMQYFNNASYLLQKQ